MGRNLFLAATSGEVSLTIFEIGAIFGLLGILALIALRLRISSVPLFLLAGLAFGQGGIFQLELSEQFLNVGAEIGALLLLLVLGFEYSARELVDSLKKRWHSGLVDFLLNAIPAAALALIFGMGPLGALAMGGIMYVSSSGIATQLIRETGWSRSDVAIRSVGVLVIEDLMLAPYLPILAAAVLGLGVAGSLISVGVALAVTVGVFVISFGRDIPGLRTLAQHGPGALLLLVFGVALAAAGLSNLAGFSGAVAAFLVGLLLTGEVAESLRNRFAPLRDLFSAIFFLFFGLSISATDVWDVLPVAAVFAAVGIIGKFGVGWWMGRGMTDHMSWRRIGAFLSSRGEFSMIIATTVAVESTLANLKELTLAIVVLTATFSTLAIRAFRSRFDN